MPRFEHTPIRIPIKGISRDAWLTLRRKGLGGSDAAAVLGLNAYESPYSVWADKTGLLPEKEETEGMRQGRDLEDYVAKRFSEESGKRVTRLNAMLKHPEHSFMLANIDRAVVGERAGLECKTTSSMNLKKFKNGTYPDTYYCQCMHYLAVTGWEKWYLAVLILGKEFRVFEIERDEDEIASLIDAEARFWKLVEDGTPPPVDGVKATSDALNASADRSGDGEYDLSGMDGDFERLEQINEMVKALKKEGDEIKQKAKVRMDGLGKGYCRGYEVLWSEHQRAVFDKAALLQSLPKQILAKIIKVKQYTSFHIRKAEPQCD